MKTKTMLKLMGLRKTSSDAGGSDDYDLDPPKIDSRSYRAEEEIENAVLKTDSVGLTMQNVASILGKSIEWVAHHAEYMAGEIEVFGDWLVNNEAVSEDFWDMEDEEKKSYLEDNQSSGDEYDEDSEDEAPETDYYQRLLSLK